MTTKDILSLLPYSKPFLFVDTLERVDENGVIGTYTYPANASFYEGHFKDFPITPGVILTETMSQIGLVCLAIYLHKKPDPNRKAEKMFLVASNVQFFLPVFPEETVKVISEKIYFRFGKLKCKVIMKNSKNEMVCEGIISGMSQRFKEIATASTE